MGGNETKSLKGGKMRRNLIRSSFKFQESIQFRKNPRKLFKINFGNSLYKSFGEI